MAQADMEEPARVRFSETNLDCLRTLIRLTIEFHYYLQTKRSGTPDQDNFIRNYVCDSVFGGITSLRWVTVRYQGLIGATRSKAGWESISGISASSFNEQFFAMFEEFSAEFNFETNVACSWIYSNCRLSLPASLMTGVKFSASGAA